MSEQINIRQRVKEMRFLKASALQGNEGNWRTHPAYQRQVLRGVLADIGIAGGLVAYHSERHGGALVLIDGHARKDEGEDLEWPVMITDLTDDEADTLLAVYDPIGALAGADVGRLSTTMGRAKTGDATLQSFLGHLAAQHRIGADPAAGGATGPAADYGEDGEDEDDDLGGRGASEAGLVQAGPSSAPNPYETYFPAGTFDASTEIGPDPLTLGPASYGAPAQPAAYPPAPGAPALADPRTRDGRPGVDYYDDATPAQSLHERFIAPPFTILDTRQGYWTNRKRAWVSMGLQSELGRDVKVYNRSVQGPAIYELRNRMRAEMGRDPNWDEIEAEAARLNYHMAPGVSIFDPVLTELMYTWFCPAGGTILDPFAGGSVRGVVAAFTGRRYTGVDLRGEQVLANRDQWITLKPKVEALKGGGKTQAMAVEGDFVDVKVSAAMARTPFHGCDPDYIKNVCHASCCQSSTSPTGTMITIHPSEIDVISARGGVVVDGLLQPKEGCKVCPFKTTDHLCGLHFTEDKPFGCIASPFTLNKNGTLIIRNRYKMLKCYNEGEKIPAYIAFRASLDLILGEQEAQRLHDHLAAGGADTTVRMPRSSYDRLRENDEIKHAHKYGAAGAPEETPDPVWIEGDSAQITHLATGSYDFVFTCPPYGDLEVYSDKAEDISNMDYADFRRIYGEIIAQAVRMLKQDRFAGVVVGDFRDKKGFYRNFVSHTIQAFEESGATLYNEAVLVNAIGSAAIRAGKQVNTSRKLVKIHQNVLLFFKGDPATIRENFGDVVVTQFDHLISTKDRAEEDAGTLVVAASTPQAFPPPTL